MGNNIQEHYIIENMIGFGGGCHWCTEAVFVSLKGIEKVEQGFIKSIAPNNSYSEAILVRFNPFIISLNDLLEIHLYTHSSTSQHSMRDKYRSAVYCFSDDQKEEVGNIFKLLVLQFDEPIITQVLPFIEFKTSFPQYQNYYYNDPQKPFCNSYIHPKIQFLKQKYAKLVDWEKHAG